MYDTAVTGLVPAATLNRIQWQLYMASPPPDAPPCGWKNEFCQPPIGICLNWLLLLEMKLI